MKMRNKVKISIFSHSGEACVGHHPVVGALSHKRRLDSIFPDRVAIQKDAQSLPVMPVPDQVRDDGSGIQYCKMLKKHWIPGQARNDEKMNMQSSDNCDTLCFAGMTRGESKNSPTPHLINKIKKQGHNDPAFFLLI